MAKQIAALWFEALEDRVILSGAALDGVSEPPDAKPAEFYKGWIELNSVTQTVTRAQLETTDASSEFNADEYEQKVHSFSSEDFGTEDADGGLDDGSIPTETLSLNFDKVQWRYWSF